MVNETVGILEEFRQQAVELCGPLPEMELPSALVGYEQPLFWLVVFFFLVVVLDVYLRSKLRRKRLVDPRKNPSLPRFIPFEDPIWQFGSFFFAVVSGNGKQLRDAKYIFEQNMKSEEENGCKCRQVIFFGLPMAVSWDADHFREVATNLEDYGKVMGFSKGFDDISRKSILNVEGEEWRDQKRLIHPAFQFTHIKNQIPKFNVVARRFISRLESLEGPVEMMPWMSKATLDGLSLAGFGLDMGALMDKNTGAYEVYTKTMARFEEPLAMLPLYEDLPTPYNIKWRESIRLYVKYLTDLVGEKRLRMLEEERLGEEREGKDILDVLIAARDEDESTGLSDEELIHNVNIFFIAGHETSSSTLSFAAHMLAEHPNVQDQLYNEIQTVVGNREPSHEDFTSLKFTACFLKEVMRFYPAALGILRRAKKDLVLGDYVIDEGSIVLLSSYSIHRHPAYWERADEFWPERFLPENSKGRHPFAYTPFSAGQRACIGKQFALMEMKILLVHLVQTFKILQSPDSPTPFSDDIGVVLRPPVGSTVILEKRKRE